MDISFRCTIIVSYFNENTICHCEHIKYTVLWWWGGPLKKKNILYLDDEDEELRRDDDELLRAPRVRATTNISISNHNLIVDLATALTSASATTTSLWIFNNSNNIKNSNNIRNSSHNLIVDLITSITAITATTT